MMNCISIKEISEHDIFRAAKKIKNKLIVGPDQIPSFVVKDCVHAFIEPLLHLFNLILRNKVYPISWKTARICPVLKKGDPSQIDNYRPISILCNFSKLLEIILYTVVSNSVKNVISKDQHGFQDKKSCITNLSCISQFLADALDRRSQVDVIYFDLQKAFDQIDLEILIHKLGQFGFTADMVDLFRCYLFNRYQYVEIEGHKSMSYIATSGVPQGSNLGPLLFLLFIDDLSQIIVSPKLLYADDLKIFNIIDNTTDCLHLQDDIDSIFQWCNDNHLQLNISKCSVVSYCKKYVTIEHEYKIQNTNIKRCREIIDLGITFDQKLTFIPHMDKMISSANKMYGFLVRQSRDFRNTQTMTTIYYSFVRSKLEYGALIWYPVHFTHVANIERVQRRFLKYLVYKTSGNYPERGIGYSVLLDQFNFVPLSTRRLYVTIKFLYKLISNHIICEDLLSKIDFLVPRVNSRHHFPFYCVNYRTNVLRKSPIVIMCQNFNAICQHCDIFSCSVNDIYDAVVGATP